MEIRLNGFLAARGAIVRTIKEFLLNYDGDFKAAEIANVWLSDFRFAKKRLEDMKERLSSLRSFAENPKCKNFPSVISSIIDLEPRYYDLISEREKTILETEGIFSRLDERSAYILYHYYILGETVLFIGHNLHYDPTYVSKLKTAGLFAFGEIMLKENLISA